MLVDEKRGIDETYTSACSTSDLRVEADRPGDADVLIASGWSPTRIGSALLRLHSEFDRAEMPTKPTRKRIEALAVALRRPHVGICAALERFERKMKPDEAHVAEHKRLKEAKAATAITMKEAADSARAQAYDWYVAELEKLMGKLKSLPDVRREVTAKAELWGMEDAAAKVPGVIGWWLFQRCLVCDGTKEQVVQGSNRQSGKACRGCQGSGTTTVPYGAEGRKVANFLDDAVQSARISIRKRLHQL